MPYEIDESLNPLIIVHMNAALSNEAAIQMFDEIDAALSKLQTFSLVLTVNFEGNHERGTAKIQKNWVAANRPRFHQDCVGIAVVNPNARHVSLYAPIANKIVQRMFNCPGALFGDMAEALAWADARLPQFVA